MISNTLTNNTVTISGRISSGLEFSHKIYGEIFYYFYLEVPRLSDNFDAIIVTVSERLIDQRLLKLGKEISIDGQFRSYNNFSGSGNRLVLTVFALEINFIENLHEIKNPNQIYLSGFVCKPPIYRTTPFGREITDILLAVNRAYNKSDYIPCISWGRNARYAKSIAVGDHVDIWGRIQSRKYQKRHEDGTAEERIAFEVSVSRIEKEEDNNLEGKKEEENKEPNNVEKVD